MPAGCAASADRDLLRVHMICNHGKSRTQCGVAEGDDLLDRYMIHSRIAIIAFRYSGRADTTLLKHYMPAGLRGAVRIATGNCRLMIGQTGLREYIVQYY
jgi:hypothetical protein